ncbi:UNVERIFIED_CONTAM: hypothetical protein FKN15_022064 [Acipenser sinensis]
MLPKNCQTKASAFVQSHKCELITWFQSDSSYILQKAHSKDLLTQLEYQRIKSTQDPAERVTELLDIMLGRGEETCQKFRNMLTEVQDTYPQLGDLLEQLSIQEGGPLALSFKPSLTLAEVEQENAKVVEGQYEPADCQPRQSVAILIPHRSREKHLLYLLQHLHPFLQRQQLHYAIYIIHQPSLTLAEVEQENAKVVEGQYEPADCQPRQSVAILIPHRSREKHLLYLLQHLHPFLQRQQLHYAIYIIHQVQDDKGHTITPGVASMLRYKGYFGGVTAMTREQFSKVNGFSNTYWGWGGEDDDLRIRVELQRMKIVRPSPEVARYTMIFHTRDNGNEVNKDR